MAASAVRAGRTFIEMSLDTTAAQKQLRAFGRRLQKLGGSLRNLGAIGAGLGAALVAPFVLGAKALSDYGDTIAKTARRTGIAVEALSQLGFAAERTGASLGDIEKATKKQALSIVNAQRGLETYARSFRELGIDVEALARLSPEEQFLAIGSAIDSLEGSTQKAAIAQEIFGRAGTKLLPLFSEGAEGIAALRAEADRLNLTLDPETAAEAEELTDAIGDLKSASKGVFVQIGSALASSGLTKGLTTAAAGAAALGRTIKENAGIVAIVAALGVAVTVLGGAFLVLGIAITLTGTAFSALAALVGIVISPLGLVVIAIVAATAALFTFSSTAQGIAGSVGAAFKEIAADFQKAFGGIRDAISAGDLSLAFEILTKTLSLTWKKLTKDLLDIWDALWAQIDIVWSKVMGSVVEGISADINTVLDLVDKGLNALGALSDKQAKARSDDRSRRQAELVQSNEADVASIQKVLDSKIKARDDAIGSLEDELATLRARAADASAAADDARKTPDRPDVTDTGAAILAKSVDDAEKAISGLVRDASFFGDEQARKVADFVKKLEEGGIVGAEQNRLANEYVDALEVLTQKTKDAAAATAVTGAEGTIEDLAKDLEFFGDETARKVDDFIDGLKKAGVAQAEVNRLTGEYETALDGLKRRTDAEAAAGELDKLTQERVDLKTQLAATARAFSQRLDLGAFGSAAIRALTLPATRDFDERQLELLDSINKNEERQTEILEQVKPLAFTS